MSQGGTFSILLLCMVPAERGGCPSRQGESPTPQAAVRALRGRRWRFLHRCTAGNLPVRGGCGHIARAGCECGAGPDTWWQCGAGSAAEGAPGRAGCRAGGGGLPGELLLRRRLWCAAVSGMEEVIWEGWTLREARVRVSALAMARLPQANPLIRGTGIRGWTKFLMHRLDLLIFFFVNIQRTIRCLAIVFPSNRKVRVTPHS